MSCLLIGSGAALVAIGAIAWILITPPQVPNELSGWPSLGFLYLQLVRSALLRKKLPKDLKGKPIQVNCRTNIFASPLAFVRVAVCRMASFCTATGVLVGFLVDKGFLLRV